MIKSVIAVIGIGTALLLLAVTSATQRQGATESSSECAIVSRALADFQQVKPGVKRKDVEKLFKYEDGLQFPDNARYAYRSCEYIKLEVQFDAAPSRGGSVTSPEDTVRAVSKLFIDYPTKD